jgi:flagellar export protein FliJ
MKEKAETELAKARQQLDASRKALGVYRNSVKNTRDLLRTGLKERMSAAELMNVSDYLYDLHEKIVAKELEVVEREKVARVKMATLLGRTKEYKVMEKLKERDLNQWQYEQNLLEQKRLNEVAIQRHGKHFL